MNLSVISIGRYLDGQCKVDCAFKKRTGLRSQSKNPQGQFDDDWESAVSEVETTSLDFKVQGARPKTCQAQSLSSTEVGFSNIMVILFRDFLAAQQRRDDVLLGELRGLQVSLEKLQQPVQHHQSEGGSQTEKEVTGPKPVW